MPRDPRWMEETAKRFEQGLDPWRAGRILELRDAEEDVELKRRELELQKKLLAIEQEREQLVKKAEKWQKEQKKLAKETNKSKFQKGVKALGGALATISKGAFSPALMAIEGIMGAFSIMAPILEALQPLFDMFGILMDTMGASIIQTLIPVFQKLFDAITHPTVLKIFELLGDVIGNVLLGLFNGLLIVFEALEPALTPLIDLLSENTELFELLGKIIAFVVVIGLIPLVAAIYGVGVAVAAIVDFFKNIVTGTWDTWETIDAWNDLMLPVLEGMGTAAMNIFAPEEGEAPDQTTLDLETHGISEFAEGGIALKPTFGVFGEKPPGEALIPLDQLDKFSDNEDVVSRLDRLILLEEERAEREEHWI